MWHTAHLFTRTHPHPHWILGSPWSLGAQCFSQEDTGIWERVRRMPCAVYSTQPGGQARGDPGLGPEIPFGSLHLVSFSFVASASLLFLPSGVHYTISDDVTKLRSLVGFKYVEGFAFGCFTLKKIRKLPQRQETHPELTQRDVPSCQLGGAEAC